MRRVDAQLFRTLPRANQKLLLAWLKCHKLNPGVTESVETVGRNKVQIIVFELNDEGKRFFRPNTQDVAKRVVILEDETHRPWEAW